MNKLKDST